MKLRPRIVFYNILQPDKLEAESHRYRINWYPQLSGDRFRHHGRENDLEGSHLPYGNIYRMQCMERELAIRLVIIIRYQAMARFTRVCNTEVKKWLIIDCC